MLPSRGSIPPRIVGNIFCEFTDDTGMGEDELHKVLHEAAVNIQYILPEFREVKL